MTERVPETGTARAFQRNGLRAVLIVLPIFVILFVVVLGSLAIYEINNWTLSGKAYGPESLVEFNNCLASQKEKAKDGQVPIDAITACETSANSANDQFTKSKVDDLKWMLTIIGSIGAFFVIAQSGAALFSALLYTQQAEKSLKSIDEIEKAVLARYPVFGAVEEQRAQALTDLALDIKTSSRTDNPNADPTEVMDYEYKDTLYASMDIRKRQRLLSLESFASIDLHPGPMGADAYPANLRRFAIFYQSKFSYEARAGFGSIEDLERAEGYLRLAIDRSRADFTLHNDLGVLCLDALKAIETRKVKRKDGITDGVDYGAAAREAFLESLRIEEHQMRAHYNLAIFEAVYGKPEQSEDKESAKARHYQNAIKELNVALNLRPKRWQRSAPPKVAESMIFYNRGCYVAWLLGNDQNQPTLEISDAQKFLDDFSEAAKLGGISKHVIDADFDPQAGDDSDIIDAYKKGTPALQQRLNEIKAELLAGIAPPEQKGFWEALRLGLDAGLNAFRASKKKL